MATNLSDTEQAAIATAVSKYLIANGRGSLEAGEWPVVLGDKLFARAIEGRYFGPPGSISGLDYSVAAQKGAQVKGEDNDHGSKTYTLYVDGAAVATQDGDGNFDTVAFAKRHGQSI